MDLAIEPVIPVDRISTQKAPQSASAATSTILDIPVLPDPTISAKHLKAGVHWGRLEDVPLWGMHPASADLARSSVRGASATIDQGALGDCWLDAPMGAIALQQPDRLRSMIADPVSRAPENIRAIKAMAATSPYLSALLKGDISAADRTALKNYWLVSTANQAHLVSKDLPLTKHGLPAYAASTGKALWPAILEKTVAAETSRWGHTGSYQALEGGWARWGYESLLGQTPKKIAKPANVLGWIRDELAAGQPVCIGTNDGVKSYGGLLPYGLVDGHMYIARDVADIHDPRSTLPHQLLRTLNPWCEDEPWVLNESQVMGTKAANGSKQFPVFGEVESPRGWFELHPGATTSHPRGISGKHPS